MGPGRRALWPGLLLCAACCGCYNVGFATQLERLAVPTFANETLRRDFEVSLTRSIRRELLETTPIQLAAEDSGAPTMRGRIADISEGLLLTGPAEEVLQSSVTVTVVFGVYDPRDGALVIGDDLDGDGRPDAEYTIQGFAEFDSTAGENRDTATEEALLDLAEMVVFRLAEREDDRFEPNQDPGEAASVGLGEQVELIQRDVDYFSLRLGPRQQVSITCFYPGDVPLVLEARDAQDRPRPAELSENGRVLTLITGSVEETIYLRVAGPDDGERYSLLFLSQTLPPADRPGDAPAEPDRPR